MRYFWTHSCGIIYLCWNCLNVFSKFPKISQVVLTISEECVRYSGGLNKLRCAEKIGLGKQLDDDGNAWPALSLAQAIRNRHGSEKGSIFQASIRPNIAKYSPNKCKCGNSPSSSHPSNPSVRNSFLSDKWKTNYKCIFFLKIESKT